jgi:hypothetical protein
MILKWILNNSITIWNGCKWHKVVSSGNKERSGALKANLHSYSLLDLSAFLAWKPDRAIKMQFSLSKS